MNGSHYAESVGSWFYEYSCADGHGQVQFGQKHGGSMKINESFLPDSTIKYFKGGFVSEEGVIPVRENIAKIKELHELQQEWLDESKKTGEPICPTCVRNDYVLDKLNEKEFYQKRNKLHRDSRNRPKFNEVRETSHNSRFYGQVTQVEATFKCEMGHSLTVSYTPEEFDAIFKKEKAVKNG